ncbi:MAG: hypothetical protein K2X93_22300 [Candidatus Obscuribacterales bacterium]|nr:hypothetical protein [Candidatus Obscuribacterales bacterium]
MALEAKSDSSTQLGGGRNSSTDFNVLRLLLDKNQTQRSDRGEVEKDGSTEEDQVDPARDEEQALLLTTDVEEKESNQTTQTSTDEDLKTTTANETQADIMEEQQGDDDDDDDVYDSLEEEEEEEEVVVAVLDSFEEDDDDDENDARQERSAEVNTAIEQANKLTPKQRQSIAQLHEFFSTLNDSDLALFNKEAIDGLIDENKGTIRDENGQVAHQLKGPYFGKHTREAFRIYTESFEKSKAPNLVKDLIELGAAIPAGFPINLSQTEKGKVENPQLFFEQIASGRREVKLGIDSNVIPDSATIAKMRAVEKWTTNATVSVETEAGKRTIEIATRRAQSMENIPKTWKIDTQEKAMAAMIVMSRLQEGIDLVHAIDNLEKHVTGSAARDWREPISKLPSCFTYDGKTARIAPNSLPESLNLQSPEMLRLMRELEKWSEKASKPVEQIFQDARRTQGASRIALSYTWMDLAQPNHFVNQEGADGIPQMTKGHKPDKGNWISYNLLEMRCETKEIRENKELTGIVLSSTARYCDVHWLDPDLFKRTAEGTREFRRDSGVLAPNTMVAIMDGEESQKFMRARDVQSFVDDKRFWHWTGKIAALTFDTATIASGYGTLKYGKGLFAASQSGKLDAAALKAVAKQEAKHGSQATVKLTELVDRLQIDDEFRKATMKELSTLAKREISHGYRQLLLGGTYFLNNANAEANPILNPLGKGRGIIFQGSILKGTLFDPGKRLLVGKIGNTELSMTELLAGALKEDSPGWLRTLSSTSQYGFVTGQVFFGADAIHSLLNMKRPREETPIGKALERSKPLGMPSIDPKSDAKQIQIAYQNYIDSIPLSEADNAKIAELVRETKKLIEPPRTADGTIDKKSIDGWRAQRDFLFRTRLAPLLLLSGDDIAKAEKKRGEEVGFQTQEFRDKKMYTASEIHELEQNGLKPVDGDLRKVLVATALCLSRNENGKFDLGDSKDNLFERNVTVNPWLYEMFVFRSQDIKVVPGMVPSDGSVRSIHQTLKTSELMQDLEKSLLRTSSAQEKLAAGEFAARAGMPAETVAASLQNMLKTDASLSPEQQRQALLMLTAVAAEMSKAELTSDADRQALSRVLGAGNSAKDIRELLGNLPLTNANPDTQALATLLKCTLERRIFDEQDAKRLDELLATPEKLTRKVIMQACIDDLRKEPGAVVDLDRSASALKTLMSLASSDGKLEGTEITVADLIDFTATLVEDSAKFVDDQKLDQVRKQLLSPANKANKEEFERLTKQFSKLEFDRLNSMEIALDAAKQLLQRDRTTGKTGVSLLNAGNQNQQASIRDARTALLGYLKSEALLGKVPAVRDLAIRRDAIKAISDLLPSPSHAGEEHVAAKTQKQQFAELLSKVLSNQSQGGIKLPGDNATSNNVTVLFADLLQVARQNEEIRVAAVEALAKLQDSQAQRILERSSRTDQESSPEVRLKALRGLRDVVRGGDQEYVEFLQSTLRDVETVETDPAIRVFLHNKTDDADFRLQAQSSQINITAKDARTRLSLNSEDSKFSWLPPARLQSDIDTARDKVNEMPWGLRLSDAIKAESDPTYKSIRVKNQEEVFEQYKKQFSAVKQIATFGNGNEAQEARQALFFMAAADHDGSLKSTNTARYPHSEKFKAAFKHLVIDDQTIKKFQVEAASTLADLVSSVDNKRRLPMTSGMKEVEGMLLSLIGDRSTPLAVQWQALRGLESLSRPGDQKLGEAFERSYSKEIADALSAMLKPRLEGDPTEEQRNNLYLNQEDRVRQALALKMIKYLESQPFNSYAIDALNTIAKRTTNDNEVLFFGPIVQRSLEVVADKSERLPKSAAKVNGQSKRFYSTEECDALLTEALNHATFAKRAGEGAGVPKVKDGLAADQSNENKKAIHKILETSNSLGPGATNDDTSKKLVDIMKADGVGDQVKIACALSVVRKANNPQHRLAAIQHLAQQSIQADSFGVRSDAREILSKLTASDDLKTVEIELQSIRKSLAKKMDPEGQHIADGIIDEQSLFDNFRKLNDEKQDEKRSKEQGQKQDLVERYATVLSLLAEVQLKQHNNQSSAENAQLSLNLWLGEKSHKRLPLTTSENVDSFALKNVLLQRYAANPNFLQVARTLDLLALAKAATFEHEEAGEIAATGFMLRKTVLGPEHPETVRGIGTLARVNTKIATTLRSEAADLQQMVDRDRRTEEDLNEQLHGPNALELKGELNHVRKSLDKNQKDLLNNLSLQVARLEFAAEKQQEQLIHLQTQFGLNANSTLNAINECISTLEQKIAAKQRLASVTPVAELQESLRGQIKQDQRLLEQRLTLEISRREKSFDAGSPWVTNLRTKLAGHLSQQGPEGQKKAREELSKVERALPSIATREKAENYFNLGALELRLNNRDQAMEQFKKQLETIGTIYGNNLDVYARTLISQGIALSDAQADGEAEAKILAALEIHKKKGNSSTFSDYLLLAEISQKDDANPAKALGYLRESLSKAKDVRGDMPAFKSTSEQLARISKTLCLTGQSENAKEWLSELFALTNPDDLLARKIQTADELRLLLDRAPRAERPFISVLLSWVENQ